jgi:DNA-3-methyladenine glycosylase
MVVETEAYEGEHDLASHSARERTPRTEVIFGPAGRFYIYRIYGLDWMLNVVTGNVGDAAAVLIPASSASPVRAGSPQRSALTLHGRESVPATGLWFEASARVIKARVTRTPRIGVEYAAPVWSAKKLRFVLE